MAPIVRGEANEVEESPPAYVYDHSFDYPTVEHIEHASGEEQDKNADSADDITEIVTPGVTGHEAPILGHIDDRLNWKPAVDIREVDDASEISHSDDVPRTAGEPKDSDVPTLKKSLQQTVKQLKEQFKPSPEANSQSRTDGEENSAVPALEGSLPAHALETPGHPSKDTTQNKTTTDNKTNKNGLRKHFQSLRSRVSTGILKLTDTSTPTDAQPSAVPPTLSESSPPMPQEKIARELAIRTHLDPMHQSHSDNWSEARNKVEEIIKEVRSDYHVDLAGSMTSIEMLEAAKNYLAVYHNELLSDRGLLYQGPNFPSDKMATEQAMKSVSCSSISRQYIYFTVEIAHLVMSQLVELERTYEAAFEKLKDPAMKDPSLQVRLLENVQDDILTKYGENMSLLAREIMHFQSSEDNDRAQDSRRNESNAEEISRKNYQSLPVNTPKLDDQS